MRMACLFQPSPPLAIVEAEPRLMSHDLDFFVPEDRG